MGRALTGKQHVGTRRERRPNGDVYVYERITGYDPKARKTKTLSTRLLGKIPAGTEEMVPTRPRKKASEGKKTVVEAERTHFGLCAILEWTGRESGIDQDLLLSFGEEDALKLASVARYWLATDGAALTRLADWQIMNPLPYAYPMTEDVCGELFDTVGRDESGVQSYFRRRAERAGPKGPLLALDTVKLLVLYSTKSREPVAFVKQPGNIPDNVALVNALRQLEVLGLPSPVTVVDDGLYSQEILTHFARDRVKFLMPASNADSWVRDEIDAARDELSDFANICPFDAEVSGVKHTRTREFATVRRRPGGRNAVGETEKCSRRLYVHVFHNLAEAPEHEQRMRLELLSLKEDLENGIEEFRPSAQKLIDCYLTVARTAKGVKVGFNMAEIQKTKRYRGYFILVSNAIKDPFEALEAYRAREKTEELFATYKEGFNGNEPRRPRPESLRGRQFAQFVGLGYHGFLTKRILDLRAKLGTPEPAKSKDELGLEMELRSWLEETSLIGILDRFRCIDFITATGGKQSASWTTETTRRDELFLRLLGVTA